MLASGPPGAGPATNGKATRETFSDTCPSGAGSVPRAEGACPDGEPRTSATVCRNAHGQEGRGHRGAAHAGGGCGRLHGGSARPGGRRARARLAHRDSVAHARADRDAHVITSETPEANAHAGGYANPDPDPDPDIHPRARTESDQDTDGDPGADPCRQAHGDAEADSDSDSDSDS